MPTEEEQTRKEQKKAKHKDKKQRAKERKQEAAVGDGGPGSSSKKQKKADEKPGEAYGIAEAEKAQEGGRKPKVRKTEEVSTLQQDAPVRKKEEAWSASKPPKVGKNDLKVYVGGVPWNVDMEVLREDFEVCGEIEHMNCLRDEYGRFKGMAFLTFKTPEGVEKALQYDGDEYGGRILSVSMAAKSRKEEGKKGK